MAPTYTSLIKPIHQQNRCSKFIYLLFVLIKFLLIISIALVINTLILILLILISLLQLAFRVVKDLTNSLEHLGFTAAFVLDAFNTYIRRNTNTIRTEFHLALRRIDPGRPLPLGLFTSDTIPARANSLPVQVSQRQANK